MSAGHGGMTTDGRPRILSGMRPTGRLHLGNYAGVLVNWIGLQDSHRCYFMVADLHALTTAYDRSREVKDSTREMVLEWLAAGLDPDRSTLFVQSQVPEHAELHLYLSMLMPLGRLTRNPTVKEMVRDLRLSGTVTYGLVGYPVLQAADILLYKANVVPVGEDQAPHLEITREIARRFNSLFGPVFPEPQTLLNPAARLPGTDGRRMSKSLGNYIGLTEDPESIKAKVAVMVTDPQKVRRGDPGRPEVCTVYATHRAFGQDLVALEADCRGGTLGCVACKGRLAEVLAEALAPIRRRREELLARPGVVEEVLAAGRAEASRAAGETMAEVRRAVFG
ncbi:MAG: tryptophan--tRNA ligase [Acetobacteraceae bacterium]|nr:tryptophan--tRNA ligase [Acetobacteraceae bacterium]